MSTAKSVAIALIVIGVLALAYGGFTYTNDHQEMRVGSMSMTMSERSTIPIPLWAGIAAVVLGTGLLLVPARKS
jgi:uncharacterized membrane protein YidH (DUF202 family)